MLPITTSASMAGIYDIFRDVQYIAWYAPGVNYTYHHGYLLGTAPNTFSPDKDLNRATVVQALANIVGENTSEYSSSNSFTDVASGEWYHNAVEWARAKNIVSGTTSTTFSPLSLITRQDLAVMLYNFSINYACRLNNNSTVDMSAFVDNSEISAYARVSIEWAVSNGIIAGTTDTTISPRANATRGQFALLLTSYDETIGHAWGTGVVEAERTNTSPGSVKYVCKNCNKVKNIDDAAFHAWDDGKVTKDSTSTQEGEITYTCTICNNIRVVSVSDTSIFNNNYEAANCSYCSG